MPRFFTVRQGVRRRAGDMAVNLGERAAAAAAVTIAASGSGTAAMHAWSPALGGGSYPVAFRACRDAGVDWPSPEPQR